VSGHALSALRLCSAWTHLDHPVQSPDHGDAGVSIMFVDAPPLADEHWMAKLPKMSASTR
jgi:hypothetical protein